MTYKSNQYAVHLTQCSMSIIYIKLEEKNKIKTGATIWDDENVLGMDSDDSCTTMWMYLIPLNCTLKNG